MKHFFTISMALCIASTMFATTPQAIESTISKQQAFKALFQNPDSPVGLQVKMRDNAVATPASNRSLPAAPKLASAAEIDTIDLYFEQFYNDPIYYEVDEYGNGGDWYIVLHNEVYQFIFDYYGGTPDDCTGTFSVEDVDKWAWAIIPEAEGKSSYYETCDFTVSAEKRGDNATIYTLDAFVTVKIGWEGEVYAAFNIHATHEALTPSTIIETAFVDANITPEDDQFTIYAKNDSIEMTLPIITDLGVQGYFSEEHIDLDNCQLVYNNQEYTPMLMESVITTAELQEGGVAYVGFMEITTTDTTFFNIVFQAPITALDTVELVCHNLVLDDMYGFTEQTIYFQASNDDYSVFGAYNDTEIIAPASYEGTTSGGKAGAIITHIESETAIQAFHTKLQVNVNRKGGYIIYMEALGSDHILYNARLAWDVPTPIDTVDLKFETSAKVIYYPYDDFGNNIDELQLAHYNNDYSVAFDIMYFKDVLDQPLDLSNLFADYSFITKHTEDEDINVVFAKLEGLLTQKGDSTLLTASIIGFDSILYNVDMFYAVPVPTDTVTCEFSLDNTYFNNYLPQNLYELEAMSEDGQIQARVRVTSDKVEGTYINDGQFERCDFVASETYVGIWDAATEKYVNYAVDKGSMTVTLDGENITAVASFICNNAVQYDLTFHALYERAKLPYDTEDQPVDQSYTEDNATIVITGQDWIDRWGMIGVTIFAKDSSSTAELWFYSDKLDPEIGLPEGTYPINGSGEPGTMLASRGVLADYTASPSYYLTLLEGLIPNYSWWIIEGTTTVENVDGKLSIVVDAINSYEMPIKIQYLGATAVENTLVETTTTTKQLINGQLLIIRNNEVYTVTGVRVK